MTSLPKLWVALLFGALVAAGALFYQGQSNIPVIGILHPTKVHRPAVMGFIDALKEYGYEEGRSIVYHYEGPAGVGASLIERAKELRALHPDVIYTASTPATKAALEATRGTDIVVVFGPVNDPVGAGFVESLRRPRRPVTGVTLAPSTAKRLGWFTVFSPDIRHVLIPYNPEDKSSTSSLRRLEVAASSLGLDLEPRIVRTTEEVRVLFRALPDGVDGVFLPRDSMINAAIDELVPAAIEREIPVSGPGYNQAARGALFSYGVQQSSVGRTAARLVNEVLSGTDPAVIPVETVDSHLYINTETAKAIGLEISPAILAQAKKLLP